VLVIVVAVLAVCALAMALVPPLREWCVESVLPALRRSGRSFLEVVRSPRSLVMLLGGSALVTVMNVAAFGVSLRAFGEAVPWATVAVVYLAGSAVASAAPTPGGLGATEAALVAGLVVVDVPETVAVPAVLVFRLATFWLPILPGWISFTVLQRRGDV
jgi:undecaprenyl-diphosphatase